MATKYTQEEIELFAQEYFLSGDASKAYRKMRPDTKAKAESVHTFGWRLSSTPEVKERLAELERQARVEASSRFSITVEQRLKWLQEIVEAGKEVYLDQLGNKRRENLAASRAAIATMNDMLGVSDEKASTRKSFNVTFRVEDASLNEE